MFSTGLKDSLPLIDHSQIFLALMQFWVERGAPQMYWTMNGDGPVIVLDATREVAPVSVPPQSWDDLGDALGHALGGHAFGLSARPQPFCADIFGYPQITLMIQVCGNPHRRWTFAFEALTKHAHLDLQQTLSGL